MHRRQFIRQSLALSAIPGMLPHAWLATSPGLNGLEAAPLTRGPHFHWFGYHDKLQVDPAGRRALGMRVAFEGRSPRIDDLIRIGLIDMESNNRWIEIGASRAWNWRQGCMLQWIPGAEREVIWNDRQEGRFVSHIFNIRSGVRRTLPAPIYAVSPDGKTAASVNFSRLQTMHPGYGYTGIRDHNAAVRAPEDDGIHLVNLHTGATKLLFSFAEAARIPHNGKAIDRHWHWFNHLLIDPSGGRVAFLHRWRESDRRGAYDPSGGFITRMFTLDLNGGDPFVLDPSGHASHFVWRDEAHICSWTQPEGQAPGFYLLKDRTLESVPVGEGVMTENGHNTYVPGTNNEWILCDTYPIGPERLQYLYLYHAPSNRRIELGQFHSPPEYTGEWRCDLHPKCTADGKKVLFDSAHGGNGRQIYMMDISEIIARVEKVRADW
jgi:hypothetical protein